MREKRQRAQGSPIRALFPVLAFALVLLLAITAEAWVSTLTGWALAACALGALALLTRRRTA